MTKDLLLTAALAVIIIPTVCLGKPTEIATNSDTLDPAVSTASDSSESGVAREQRSPQFGLLGDYGDYSDYDDYSRGFSLGHKRKFHKPHRKPFGLFGGHGCRGLGCGGGWHQGGHDGYNHGQGSSFATASAGGGGGPYGGHSEANAQSATFSLGPYSATFSVAQASSGHRGF